MGATWINASSTVRAPGWSGIAGSAADTAATRAAESPCCAVQLTQASMPRGASECARTAWASTVVLPNPGPASTTVTGWSQRSASSSTSRTRGISTSSGRGSPVETVGSTVCSIPTWGHSQRHRYGTSR
jgi:hypothetical protein